MQQLQNIIETAFERRAEITPANADTVTREAVNQVIALLDSGALRVAEKIDGQWVTHQWLKKAVLLSFRINDNQVIEGAESRYFDKVPMKFANYDEARFQKEGFRVVPPAAVRQGAFIARNTVLMPSYVNIGAYVDEGTMVDTWATVGSCAQIGKNVHLSGGVGIPYHPDEEGCDIMAIGEGVRKVYEEVLSPAGMDDVAIFTEMGRYMLAPYGALVAEAIHQKHIYKEYIGLDACAANLMRPAMYGAYHHITVLGKEDAPCDHKYDITGGLCENNDKFAIDRMLPKIDMGDLIYIHDTGAHGHSMGYNYNGKLRSAELLLCENGDVKLLRRAETPADYFATFDFTGLFQK